MTTTGGDLVSQALKDIAVLAAGNTAAGHDLDDGIASLNTLCDGLGIDPGTLPAVVRTTKTLAASTVSYTIGSGGSIDLPRPSKVLRAGLILDTTATYPRERRMRVLNVDDYAEWLTKTQPNGNSWAVWYDHNSDASGFGLIYPLPIPDVGTTQLVLYTAGAPLAVWDATTDVLLPQGLARTLRKLLALELAPMYPAAVVSPLLIQQGGHALRSFHATNTKPRRRGNDPVLLTGRGVFDMESGETR